MDILHANFLVKYAKRHVSFDPIQKNPVLWHILHSEKYPRNTKGSGPWLIIQKLETKAGKNNLLAGIERLKAKHRKTFERQPVLNSSICLREC